MFDLFLRPLKDRLLAPLAKRLRGVAPGAITATGLGLGLGAAVAAWAGAFGLGLALWLANRVMDGLDGAVARLQGQASDLGGFLDLVADFAVYAAVPAAMALRPGVDPELTRAGLVLVATFYVNAASWMVPAAILEKRGRGADVRGETTAVIMPEGLVAGGETVLFYTLFFLLPPRQVTLFYLMAGLTVLTILQRIRWGIREFASRPGTPAGVAQTDLNVG